MLLKYSSEIGKPSIYYALAVMTLQIFASSLIAFPLMSVLNNIFPNHTFLEIALVMSYKPILSLFSAPLIGALSDLWGRKLFLFITVCLSYAPTLFMTINTWWFFAMVSICAIFDETFSVILAYVADVTTTEGRSLAFGFVSAAIGTTLMLVNPLYGYLLNEYGDRIDNLIVALGTIIAVLNAIFTYFVVPESLPENVRPSSTSRSWKQVHPFSAIRKVGLDHTILMQCGALLLAFIPEAGRTAYFFVYLKLLKGFSSVEVSLFLTVMEIISILAKLALGFFIRVIGVKSTIILGLVFQAIQLLLLGLGTQSWMIWVAVILAALGSITYPAILAFVSINSHADAQGVVLGIISSIHGLCYGLGPFLFYVLYIWFEGENGVESGESIIGWIMAFGSLMVVIAILVEVFIPAKPKLVRISEPSSDAHYEIVRGREAEVTLSPYAQQDSAQI